MLFVASPSFSLKEYETKFERCRLNPNPHNVTTLWKSLLKKDQDSSVENTRLVKTNLYSYIFASTNLAAIKGGEFMFSDNLEFLANHKLQHTIGGRVIHFFKSLFLINSSNHSLTKSLCQIPYWWTLNWISDHTSLSNGHVRNIYVLSSLSFQ